MADGLTDETRGIAGNSFTALLAKYIGETVTIFTSSGGESGSGFTGVVLAVNNVFVRLITRVGPPPGCSLGNACTGFDTGYGFGGKQNACGTGKGFGGMGYGVGYPGSPIAPGNVLSAQTAGGWNGYPVYTVGSVTDIPIAAIVSIVHNAV